MTLWRTFVAWLAALSADPSAIDQESPRAAVAVAASYASFADEAPAPSPEPSPECACAGKCTNGAYRPDGRIEMKCSQSCGCGCRKKAASVAEKCDCSAKNGQKGAR